MDHISSILPTPRPVYDLAPASGCGASEPSAGTALVRWVGGSPVVWLTGDLDLAITARLGAVGQLLRQWSQPRVVDAAGVTFLDASGLRAVLSLTEPGSGLLVQRPSPSVLRLVQVLLVARAGLQAAPVQGAAQTWVLIGAPGW